MKDDCLVFRAKICAQSQEFWDGVKRGAWLYDNLPEWQKGILVTRHDETEEKI